MKSYPIYSIFVSSIEEIPKRYSKPWYCREYLPNFRNRVLENVANLPETRVALVEAVPNLRKPGVRCPGKSNRLFKSTYPTWPALGFFDRNHAEKRYGRTLDVHLAEHHTRHNPLHRIMQTSHDSFSVTPATLQRGVRVGERDGYMSRNTVFVRLRVRHAI